MNILLTVVRIICQRALLVRLYSLKSAATVSKSLRSSVIWAPVELVGMSVADPGLTGTTKVVTDKVLYTAGDTVSWRRPRVPQPRLDWTEAVFELSFKSTSVMVLYV